MWNWKRTSRFALAAAAGITCMLISDNWSSLQQANLITTADARVGRPATATSVAGVARRATRRTARRGAYYRNY